MARKLINARVQQATCIIFSRDNWGLMARKLINARVQQATCIKQTIRAIK